MEKLDQHDPRIADMIRRAAQDTRQQDKRSTNTHFPMSPVTVPDSDDTTPSVVSPTLCVNPWMRQVEGIPTAP